MQNLNSVSNDTSGSVVIFDDDVNVSDIIVDLLKKKENILLNAPAGTGKSFLLRLVSEKIKNKTQKIFYCTGTTGVASINLNQKECDVWASTLHRWAGIGLGDAPIENLITKVKYNRQAFLRWKSCNILIVDEVSMLGGKLFEKLDKIGKAIRKSNKPFGGIQLLLSGDFLQLPPVKDIPPFEKKELWESLNFKFVVLDQPKRYDDLKYFEMLSRIRKNKQTKDDYKKIKRRMRSYEKLCEILEKNSDKTNVIKPTILMAKRVDVESKNISELKKLSGKPKCFFAQDNHIIFKKKFRTEEYEKKYTQLLDDCIPNKIYLKKGAQVMLKVNISVEEGLVNGSRGVVLEYAENIVKVRFVNGKTKFIEKHVWDVKDKKGIASREQFPLILAWCMTIHKSQGCTFDYAVVELGNNIFAEGQAYVAMSRIRNMKGLFVSSFSTRSFKICEKALKYTEYIESHKINIKNYDFRNIETDDFENFDDEFDNNQEDEEILKSVFGEAKNKKAKIFLGGYGISSKSDWKRWLVKNHVDKGGDPDTCRKIIEYGRIIGY